MFFFFLLLLSAISREEGEESHNNHRGHNHGNKVPYNGYTSEEFLDRLEPNGNNIPSDKTSFGKRKCLSYDFFYYLLLFCCMIFLHEISM